MSFWKKRIDAFTVVTVLLALVSLIIGFKKLYEVGEPRQTGQPPSAHSAPSDVPVVDVDAPMDPSAAAVCRQEYFATYREVLAEDDERCPMVKLTPMGYQGPWNANPVTSRSNVGDVSAAGVPDVAITGICEEGSALYVIYRNDGGSAPGTGWLEVSNAENDRHGSRIVRRRLDVELPLPGKTLRSKPIDIRLLRLDDGAFARLTAKFSMGEGIRDANAANDALERELVIDTDGSTCAGAPPPVARNMDELWASVRAPLEGTVRTRRTVADMNLACRREFWVSTGKWIGADDPLCLSHHVDEADEEASQSTPRSSAP
jgi:hypothetical protein